MGGGTEGGGTERDAFPDEGRRVLFGMAMAVAVTIAAAFAIWLLSASITLDDSLDGRLRLGATAALLPAAVVAIHVGRIASCRLSSSDLIAGAAYDGPGTRLSVDRALLSNSVEQAVMAMPTYMLLAMLLPVEQLVAVPLLALLFVVGRTFFAVRYRSGVAARSFGFALTFYPTVAGIVAAAAMLLE